MKIILGPSSKELGERIAQANGLETIPVASKTFPDGEVYVRIEGDVQSENVYIVQTTSPPQDVRLLQLAFITSAAKRNGAKKVTAIVPYLAYARQDKIFLQGETISIEVIGRMLSSAGVDELLTVNIHQENALSKFPFPARSVSAIPLLAEYFIQKGCKKAFALAPDKGAMYIAEQAKSILGGENGHLEKERDRYTGQVKIAKKEFNVKGATVIIFDDIISTGGTIVNSAKILKDLGAARIFAACVHPLLIADAEKRILDAGVEEIIGTDSVPSQTSKVTLAPLISNEIRSHQSG
jgi:ribose-phosphate pyrophosphokinase